MTKVKYNKYLCAKEKFHIILYYCSVLKILNSQGSIYLLKPRWYYYYIDKNLFLSINHVLLYI